MTNLERITAKIFGETATATGDDPQIGQFGSALAGTYIGTTDVATIQNLSAWSNGFIDSVTPNEQFPPLPEMTGFGKVLSHQIAYTLQKGVPEWDSGTTYYAGDFAKGVGEGKLYVSKVDSNINNALSDTDYWEEFTSGGARNIGEIVPSTIPLIDAGLHLLDGTLLQYGSYQAFVDYIADLYDSGDYTDIFETEANWQTAVTTYGVCGKFVYDSVNNTVRLPKYSNKIYTQTITQDAPVKGSGKAIGITNGASSPTYAGVGINDGLLAISTGTYNKTLPASGGQTQGLLTGQAIGLTTDGSKSGIIADLADITTSLEGYYYIVVATSAKTDIQVDIDEIATDLNGKADTDLSNVPSSKGILVESYKNGTSWYRVYSDGWCEQGGDAHLSTAGNGTVTFLKEFIDTNYTFICTVGRRDDSSSWILYPSYTNKTTTTQKILSDITGYNLYTNWQASGYIR